MPVIPLPPVPVLQILQYMRTGCLVDQREVVAVVYEDRASALTYPCETIKKTIDSLGIGCTKNIIKDFLKAHAKTTTISRGVLKSAFKRKCSSIWLDTLPDDIQADLKRGEILPMQIHIHGILYYIYMSMHCVK